MFFIVDIQIARYISKDRNYYYTVVIWMLFLMEAYNLGARKASGQDQEMPESNSVATDKFLLASLQTVDERNRTTELLGLLCGASRYLLSVETPWHSL